MIKKLDDICSFISGNAWKAAEFTDEGIPVIRINNLNMNNNDFKYWQGDYDKKYLIYKGDLLVSLSGTIKTFQWNGPEALLNQRIVKVCAKADTNQDWVYYQIFHVIEQIANKGKHAVIRNVSINDLKNFNVDVPDFQTQNKIVAILDKARALVEKRQKSIGLLDELMKAQFLEMFGDLGDPENKWPKKKIVEVCKNKDDIRCGPFGTQLSKSEFKETGVPLWGIKHLNSEFLIKTDEFVSHEKAIQLSNYSLQPRDIVMTRKGSIGNTHIYPSNLELGIMHSDIVRIRVNENITNPYFLSYQFKYNNEVKWQINRVSPGVVMAGINVSKLKNIFIRVPELSIQNKFEKTHKEITKLKSRLEKTEIIDLYNSILQRAFSGKLKFDVSIELDALLEEIDLKKNENDLFSIITNEEYLLSLVNRLNNQEFENQDLYDKAKHAAFQLLKEEERIDQEYDDKSKSLKLIVK